MTGARLDALRSRIEEETRAVHDSIPYLTEESAPIEPSVALGRLTRMEAIKRQERERRDAPKGCATR